MPWPCPMLSHCPPRPHSISSSCHLHSCLTPFQGHPLLSSVPLGPADMSCSSQGLWHAGAQGGLAKAPWPNEDNVAVGAGQESHRGSEPPAPTMARQPPARPATTFHLTQSSKTGTGEGSCTSGPSKGTQHKPSVSGRWPVTHSTGTLTAGSALGTASLPAAQEEQPPQRDGWGTSPQQRDSATDTTATGTKSPPKHPQQLGLPSAPV